jgi:hypothetical protein
MHRAISLVEVWFSDWGVGGNRPIKLIVTNRLLAIRSFLRNMPPKKKRWLSEDQPTLKSMGFGKSQPPSPGQTDSEPDTSFFGKRWKPLKTCLAVNSKYHNNYACSTGFQLDFIILRSNDLSHKFLRPFVLKGTYSIGQLCPNFPKNYRSLPLIPCQINPDFSNINFSTSWTISMAPVIVNQYKWPFQTQTLIVSLLSSVDSAWYNQRHMSHV